MKYEDALWKWFVTHASKPGEWGSKMLDTPEREHLLSCGLDREKSAKLEFGSITEYGNTINPDITVPAINLSWWICRCGAYGSERAAVNRLTLFATGSRTLDEVIREVIAAGDESATPEPVRDTPERRPAGGWEYHRLVMNPLDEEFGRLMGGLGADRWELVATVPSMGADPRPVWVFKRPA